MACRWIGGGAARGRRVKGTPQAAGLGGCGRALRVERAEAREQQIALRLWHGVAGVPSLHASAGERAGLVAEESRDRAQVFLDLRSPRESSGMIQQTKRQGFERLPRGSVQETRPA